jgi:arylsulfatase A-like enzyme
MAKSRESDSKAKSLSRRDFLKRTSAAGVLPGVAGGIARAESHPMGRSTAARSAEGRPNVILIISDQFRWDFLGAMGLNPMGVTPNLDEMAANGVLFRNHITNQPVCSPSRACIMTSLRPHRHGVWHNGLGLSPHLLTIAKVFRSAGYTANYIGKWHLAPEDSNDPRTSGPVPAEYRGGFDDFWEGCNALEHTSQAYEGAIWDAEGHEIRFKKIYRVDFLTERVTRFLDKHAREPFFLVVSYLEPHQQNDCNCFVAPEGYAKRYANPFVPRDLKFFPGDWQAQLPDYYGSIARLDENVGKLRRELKTRNLADRTVVAFVSDHGCHFRTRNVEYKRTAHESSVHIPFIIEGPGIVPGTTVQELTAQVTVAPTLLEAAGVPVPPTFAGKSAWGLMQGKTEGWRNEVFIFLSEAMTGRALRTPQFVYVVVSPDGGSHPSAKKYVEYQLYNLVSDPHQLVNLAGRAESREIAAGLRARLRGRIIESGDEEAEIIPATLYP